MNPIYKFVFNSGVESNNLLNPNTVARGYSITNDGELIESQQFDTTDYIPVEVGSSYHVLKNNSELYNPYWVIWFDENKNFVDNSYSQTGVFTVPIGCAYVRFDFPNETQASGGFRPKDLGFFPESITTFMPFSSIIETNPLFNDDLAKNWEKESNQEFFRAKLSGKLTFVGPDYDFIVAQPFDFQFVLEIFISYNAGQIWTLYWRGTFWKTDCEFDNDAKTVVVQPTVWDQYNDILAGLDKEYNLIDLVPSMTQIQADKRPVIQVYIPGQSVIGCFLSGMWWEQECEPESDETKLQETGDGKLNFALNCSMLIADVSGTFTPELSDVFTGRVDGSRFNPNVLGIQDFPSEDYTLRYSLEPSLTEENAYNLEWIIIRNSDSQYLFYYNELVYQGSVPNLPQTIQLFGVNGATGFVNLYIHETPVYARYLLDVDSIVRNHTYTLPDDDIVPNNRNYHRVVRYPVSDIVYFSAKLSENPTKWGIYQPGLYYEQPDLPNQTELYPVSRNAWGRISVWFQASIFDSLIERQGRAQFTIRHAYPLWSVLQKLLEQVAPNIVFRANYTCSQFFYPYDVNPISGLDFRLFITPKSNIVTAGYDQPAQKAPITLGQVFNMLRDCFRCYWFIDENNHLHIEHIQYFRNGGSYSDSDTPVVGIDLTTQQVPRNGGSYSDSDTPDVGIDLTTQQVPRNGKPWAFARNQFKFDKPEMAARYQFGWMDDVTQLFDGFPIDIISKYVNPDNVEQIDISRFTSDIDYILLNPGAVSKDGFVLLGATPQSGGYALPYYNFQIDGNDHILQNAYVAFCLLQQYYAYDMPGRNYAINGVQMVAQGIKKLKKQTVRFPLLNDPDLVELIKTNLGNGIIEKLSVNLSSRNASATLKYDTE